MTVKEFWESKEKLAIHCDTEKKANKLLKKFDELGKVWSTRESYLIEANYWWKYKEKTCYTNDGCYGIKGFYANELEIKVIEFEDLEDFKRS